MTDRFRGLTWDHPRGTDALRAATTAAAVPVGAIDWHAQPLEGFESASITENAARYDLLVLDHPHLGEAIAHDAIRPIDEVIGSAEADRIRVSSVGASGESYVVDGRLYALPLDAAAQVSVRADAGIPLPTTWDEAVELARDVPSVLPTTGPHLFLTLCSIALANGTEPGIGTDGTFLSGSAVGDALDVLRAFLPRDTIVPARHNPIDVLESMSDPDGPSYCPHVYGYVNYADVDRSRPLSFGDAPRGRAGRIGSVLGGTGIAVTRRREPDTDLVEHLRWLLSDSAQRSFVPQHAGQPSSAAAWSDPAVDRRAGGFYGATRATLDAAWVRPRHDGAIAFQRRASDLVRDALFGDDDPVVLARALDEAFETTIPSPH